jgi:transposase
MIRNRLTDAQWDLIAHVFPQPATTGRPPVCRRDVVDGILWIMRTGAPWRDLPEEFGNWSTVWDLFDKWNDDGTLDEILHGLRAARVDLGRIDAQLWCVDGTIVRAARCAGGGGKKTMRKNRLTTH